ncbi:hypothetical protein MRB53_006822 [Persea americana]|uniref:Uncharacterized protein n=1 Tax=Persea americana TaxID=3435 RepID=A0ACC2MIB5_PERAE|nr:hypothetical protein MRB53_006822 [Persea americana]
MSFLRGDYIQNEIVAQAGDHVGDLALSEDEHCRSLRFEIVQLRRVEEGSIGTLLNWRSVNIVIHLKSRRQAISKTPHSNSMESATGESNRDPEKENHPRADIPEFSASPRKSNGFRRSSSAKILPRGREEGLNAAAKHESGDAGDPALSEDGHCRSLRFKIEALRRAEEGSIGAGAGSNVNAVASTTSSLTQAMLKSRSANHSDASEEQNASHASNQKRLLVFISCRIHLAAFGILGVLTRYLLRELFGPSVIGFTGDHTVLYLDLPSNIVGSFLMGWLGIVFKGDIIHFWDLLAIGLSTGFLGSLTTFNAWNQKMLELTLEGKWALSIMGFFVGMLLVMACVYVGVATAKGFRWLLGRFCTCNTNNCCRVDYQILRTAILLLLMLLWSSLWAVSIPLFKIGFKAQKPIAKLWLASLLGPPGVWLRWFLAGYNGLGFGRSGSWKWFPFGTLAVNVLASTLMAGSTTIMKAINTKRCDIIVNGFQFGFCGCLSTVSAFVAEVYAMNQSSKIGTLMMDGGSLSIDHLGHPTLITFVLEMELMF